MRLIDADALKARIAEEKDLFEIGGDYSVGYNNGLEMAHSIVFAAPTIEAETVRHGAWVEDGYFDNPFVCSCCGHEGCYSGEFNNKQYYYTNYCPSCGAKMDLEEEKEE